MQLINHLKWGLIILTGLYLGISAIILFLVTFSEPSLTITFVGGLLGGYFTLLAIILYGPFWKPFRDHHRSHVEDMKEKLDDYLNHVEIYTETDETLSIVHRSEILIEIKALSRMPLPKISNNEEWDNTDNWLFFRQHLASADEYQYAFNTGQELNRYITHYNDNIKRVKTILPEVCEDAIRSLFPDVDIDKKRRATRKDGTKINLLNLESVIMNLTYEGQTIPELMAIGRINITEHGSLEIRTIHRDWTHVGRFPIESNDKIQNVLDLISMICSEGESGRLLKRLQNIRNYIDDIFDKYYTLLRDISNEMKNDDLDIYGWCKGPCRKRFIGV